MTNTKIITTRQKKMLENILNALDVSLDDFLQIQNLKELKDKVENLEKENIVKEERIRLLEQVNKQLLEDVQTLNLRIEENAVDQLFGGNK